MHSQDAVKERDVLSEWRSKRKPCPGIQPQSGTLFPVETTCLDIYLRPLLQVVDRFVHVEQISHDAGNKEPGKAGAHADKQKRVAGVSER